MSNQSDPTKESHYLHYLDANNLYGWAMNQNLPISGFRWVPNPEKLKDSIIELVKEVEKGYFLEVEKGYPPGS